MSTTAPAPSTLPVGGGPWSGVRVVELGGEVRGGTGGLSSAYATRMWAALGAEVIVAEPEHGHLLRHLPPFAPGSDESLWWAYFGQGKQSVVAPPGSAELAALVASADVVIGDVDPLAGAPQPAHERQVVVAITPFGLDGPRAGWAGSELIAWASSGVAYTLGFPDHPPVCLATPVQFAAHTTSLYAVNGAMLALRAARRSGRGQLVEVSMQEVCLSLAPETGVSLFLDDGIHRTRPGNRRNVTRPWGLYPCADGYVSYLIIQPAHWRAIAEWIAEATGMDAVLDDVFLDMHVRWEVSDFIDECTEALTRPRTKLDLFVEGQRRGIPTTPVNTVADLLTDPHLASSGFWREEDGPALGPVKVPGAPFRVNHDWWHWTVAPRLGEHTRAHLAG